MLSILGDEATPNLVCANGHLNMTEPVYSMTLSELATVSELCINLAPNGALSPFLDYNVSSID
jgi:hypothetical protein